MSIEAIEIEIMEADSNSGEVLLIYSKNYGYWRALEIGDNICYKGDDTFNTFLNLTIRTTSQKTFPFGLVSEPLFQKLNALGMSGLGIAVFDEFENASSLALETLNVSHNALKRMPPYAFANLPNLHEIDLSFNKISNMHHRVFMLTKERLTGLKKLNTIYLHSNDLTHINPNWFQYLPNLIELTLNDNFITDIDLCATFRSKVTLRTLHLQNNDFSAIIASGLCLNQLKTFDISNNPENDGAQPIHVNAASVNISNTNARECYITSNTIVLNASRNSINSVINSEISNTNLTELYLDHNEIASADFLIGLQSLEIIDLSHNELMEISLDIFKSVPNLRKLSVAYNKLTSIDLLFLKLTTKLTHLDISNNRLTGKFQLNVVANALTTLNIAGNDYTSIQRNIEKWAPNLTSFYSFFF